MHQKILLSLFLVLLLSCSTDHINQDYSDQLSPEDRGLLSIVPLPYHVDLKDESFTLSEPINWVFEGATDMVSKQAFSTTSSWFDNLIKKETNRKDHTN